jgi:hypothetical protein
LRAKLREHRHLPGECGTQRVDGLDAKPRRDLGRELLDYTLAHLRGSLPGKRDGDDLLGLLHRLEELEVTLYQQFGLPRARRRLHDERARDIQRRVALR